MKPNLKIKGWVVALSSIFAWIALTCVQNKVAPIATVLMEAFDISMATAGWLSSIFAVMGMVVALPAAFILKKIGTKKSGTLALLFGIGGSLLGILSTDIVVLIGSRVVEGFGVGVIAVTGPALISMWFPSEKRGLPMGIWASGMTISQALVFFFAGPITEHFGWTGMWYACLVLCIAAAIAFFKLAKSPPDAINHAKVRGDDASIAEGVKSGSPWILAFAATCFAFVAFSFGTWIAPYWESATGLDLEEVLYWVGLLYVLEVGLCWVAGALLSFKVNRKRLVAFAILVYGVTTFACFSVTSFNMMIVMVFLFPLFEALTAILLWTIARQTVERSALVGVSIAILDIGLNFGIIIGQPTMGWVVDHYGWSAGALTLLGVTIAAAVALIFVTIYDDQFLPKFEGGIFKEVPEGMGRFS